MKDNVALPSRTQQERAMTENLFGWDPTPGIVSVWVNREGRAVIWRREQGRVLCTSERFRPWLFAASLDDLSHLGAALQSATAPESIENHNLFGFALSFLEVRQPRVQGQ